MNRLKRFLACALAFAIAFFLVGHAMAALALPDVHGVSGQAEGNVQAILAAVVAVAYGAIRMVQKIKNPAADPGYTTTEFYVALAALAKIFGLGI